jgi:hypothetical protein
MRHFMHGGAANARLLHNPPLGQTGHHALRIKTLRLAVLCFSTAYAAYTGSPTDDLRFSISIFRAMQTLGL